MFVPYKMVTSIPIYLIIQSNINHLFAHSYIIANIPNTYNDTYQIFIFVHGSVVSSNE